MTYLRLLIVGVVAFVAYTLGARAGRSEYRHIKKNAKRLWASRGVRAARKAGNRRTRSITRRLR